MLYNDLMKSAAQKKASGKWEAKTYSKVLLRIRNDTPPARDDIAAAAEAVGESLNAYIMEAVKRRMDSGT